MLLRETILNSIKANKLPNAYLFTGIRGIGKTTTARIVAKGMNCIGIDGQSVSNNRTLWKIVHAISTQIILMFLKWTAASRTGVGDVRDFIEFSRYSATSAKYKIFIIDEVHMLVNKPLMLIKNIGRTPRIFKVYFCNNGN